MNKTFHRSAVAACKYPLHLDFLLVHRIIHTMRDYTGLNVIDFIFFKTRDLYGTILSPREAKRKSQSAFDKQAEIMLTPFKLNFKMVSDF